MRVGHILKVEDEELFPADLLCLYSALEDDACFIKTTNLDGESNLKIRRPLDLRDAAPEEDADVLDIHATLECEQPNADLHKFQGRLIYQSASEGECPPLTDRLADKYASCQYPTHHLRPNMSCQPHAPEPTLGMGTGDVNVDCQPCCVCVQRGACL